MTEKEYRDSIEKEVQGAENAVKKMLLYYVSALQSVGVEDVKQHIATVLGEFINLSEEQCKFVSLNFQEDGKIFANLKNSIELLKKIESDKKLDLDSVKIVRKVLELLLKDLEEFNVDGAK